MDAAAPTRYRRPRTAPLPPRVTAGRGLRRRRRLTTGASPRGVLSDGGGSGRRWRGRAEGGVDGDSPGAARCRRLGGERSGGKEERRKTITC